MWKHRVFPAHHSKTLMIPLHLYYIFCSNTHHCEHRLYCRYPDSFPKEIHPLQGPLWWRNTHAECKPEQNRHKISESIHRHGHIHFLPQNIIRLRTRAHLYDYSSVHPSIFHFYHKCIHDRLRQVMHEEVAHLCHKINVSLSYRHLPIVHFRLRFYAHYSPEGIPAYCFHRNKPSAFVDHLHHTHTSPWHNSRCFLLVYYLCCKIILHPIDYWN